MTDNISQFIKTLEKTLKLIEEENKRRDKEGERRHEEMEKMLDISTTKTDLIRQSIQEEMKRTREMIRNRYDYFGLLMSYLAAMMTGLLIYFVITPIETPEFIKSAITLFFTLITACIVFYIGYKTRRQSTIVGTSPDTK